VKPLAIIDAHVQRLHQMFMTLPTNPPGIPAYDDFFAHVARYQRARTPDAYAVLATRCQAAADDADLPAELRSSYMWLGWLALKQAAAVVQRQ
jgi:hypothetical protein